MMVEVIKLCHQKFVCEDCQSIHEEAVTVESDYTEPYDYVTHYCPFCGSINLLLEGENHA